MDDLLLEEHIPTFTAGEGVGSYIFWQALGDGNQHDLLLSHDHHFAKRHIRFGLNM